MSYFPLDANNLNEEKNIMQMTQDIPKNCNTAAHHTQPHTDEAKKRISETQTKRYEMIRQLVRKGQQKQLTEDRVKNICVEVVEKYLNRNAKLINKNNQPININI